MNKKKMSWPVLVVLALVGLWLKFGSTESDPEPSGNPSSQSSKDEALVNQEAVDQLQRLFEQRRSKVVVEVWGEVVKNLRDDLEGSRHQKFLFRVSPRQTLLVAHNIDIAPRAPVKEGQRIKIRGQYEYKDKGGVLHWTHLDPGGRRPGGWIEVDGKRYQ